MVFSVPKLQTGGRVGRGKKETDRELFVKFYSKKEQKD